MDEKKYGAQGPEQRDRMDGEQVQRELEYQLRQFGVSMSDAFQYGFEGRGQEIGDRAWDVGRAVVDAVNFGLSEAGRAMDRAREKERGASAKGAQGGRPAEGASRPEADYSGLYSGRGADRYERRARRRAQYEEASPSDRDPLRAGARKAFGVGLALAITGGIFAFGLIIGGISCLACLGMFVSGTAEYTALAITGGCLTVAGLLFGWMANAGGERLSASRRMKAYADAADALGAGQGVSVKQLAAAAQRPAKKVRKDLRRYIRRGWLTAWLDTGEDKLFLTAESYRAAHEQHEPPEAQKPAGKKKEPEPQAAQPEQPAAAEPRTALNVETVRRFAAVLEQEKRLMADAQAAEELEHMHATTQSIGDWLETHPESQPKARRFADYYIPTTLKLLHTYNDVQGQKGENAENIRRDIAGILHTLNLAYDNLYNKLLSDMALDVSSEIAALQGMLASDGLTEEGLL